MTAPAHSAARRRAGQVPPGDLAPCPTLWAGAEVAELNRGAQDVAAGEHRRVPFADPESGGAAAQVPAR